MRGCLTLRWQQWEIEYLEAHNNDGAERIARRLGRTVKSVQIQASRYGVSLQKRYYCPNCNSYSFTPLSIKTGWCRCCSVRYSRDSAAITNRQVRMELDEEKRRIRQAERERQLLYTDTERRRKELCRFNELRELNEKSEGDDE